MALIYLRDSRWGAGPKGRATIQMVGRPSWDGARRDLSAPMPSGASLSKNCKAGSKRLEDIRNSTVASFISSSFPGVRRRSS